MSDLIVGRKEEQAMLLKALDSHEAELISVIGRRRVGKTYLVRKVYQDRIVLLDRNDKVINLIEIKFYEGDFSISKDYADKLRTKIQVFRERTKTKKQIFLNLITVQGLKSNIHSLGLVDNAFDSEILFV